MNEDTINPYFKKDAKDQYKKYLRDTEPKRKQRDEIVRDIRELGVETGKSKEFIDDKVQKAKDRFAVPDFRLDRNGAYERGNFPYYITYYDKGSVYEPAEGGYYVEVQYPSYSKGYETYDEAKAELEDFINSDNNDWHEVGKDEYEWEGRYIGDGEYVRIETNKNYLKAVREYNGYESFGKKFKSRKRPSKMVERMNRPKKRITEKYDAEKKAYRFVIDTFSGIDTNDDLERVIRSIGNAIKDVYEHFGGGVRIDAGRHSVVADGWLPTDDGKKWTAYNSFDINYLKGDVERFAEDIAMAIHNHKEFSYTPALAKAMKEEYSAYDDKVKVPDGYELMDSTVSRDYTYELARNVYTDENGQRRGKWLARNVDTNSDWFPITWEQAVGYEPIEESSIGKLRKQLGKMLLPPEDWTGRNKNESVLSDRIRRNQLDYVDENDSWYSKDGDTEIQFQDRLSNTHEYAGVRDKNNRIVGVGRKLNRQPKTSSQTWGRVWKNGEFKKSFEGPKYKVRGEMINYLDNDLTESRKRRGKR